MAEYIKREDAIKIAEKYGLANGSVLGRHTGLADCIASEIVAIPTADVKEVKHGHWIHIVGYDPRDAWAECSRCRTTVKYPGTRYCPHCGAKMDEEDENART